MGLEPLDLGYSQWQDISFFASAFYQLAQLEITKSGFSVLLFKDQKTGTGGFAMRGSDRGGGADVLSDADLFIRVKSVYSMIFFHILRERSYGFIFLTW